MLGSRAIDRGGWSEDRREMVARSHEERYFPVPRGPRWCTHLTIVMIVLTILIVPMRGRVVQAVAVASTAAISTVPAVIHLDRYRSDLSPTSAASSPQQVARFRWPVRGLITQGFGPSTLAMEPSVKLGRTSYPHFHTGIDIAGPFGADVIAAVGGTVEYAGWAGGYGNSVVLLHDGGIRTVFGHLSRVLVSEGEHVDTGAVIAREGSTGASTGPHLHFEVRTAPKVVVNPLSFLTPSDSDPAAEGITVSWGVDPHAALPHPVPLEHRLEACATGPAASRPSGCVPIRGPAPGAGTTARAGGQAQPPADGGAADPPSGAP
jgi:hypothetical protein